MVFDNSYSQGHIDKLEKYIHHLKHFIATPKQGSLTKCTISAGSVIGVGVFS